MDVGSIILQDSAATHCLPHTTCPPSSCYFRKTHYSLLIFTLTPSHLISSLQSFKSLKDFQAFQTFKTIPLDATTLHNKDAAQTQGSCVHP